MGIDHRRLHVPVSEQLLNRSDVVAVLPQVSGKGVPEGMTPESLNIKSPNPIVQIALLALRGFNHQISKSYFPDHAP